MLTGWNPLPRPRLKVAGAAVPGSVDANAGAVPACPLPVAPLGEVVLLVRLYPGPAIGICPSPPWHWVCVPTQGPPPQTGCHTLWSFPAQGCDEFAQAQLPLLRWPRWGERGRGEGARHPPGCPPRSHPPLKKMK